MKYVILLVLMLLNMPPSFALSRRSATPKLHSVLDRVAATDWSMRPAGVKPAPLPVADDGLTRKQWRHIGKNTTIVGGSLLLIGAGVIGYAAYDAAQHPDADGALGVVIAGALIAIVGLVITLIGLPIWLTHLGSGKVQ